MNKTTRPAPAQPDGGAAPAAPDWTDRFDGAHRETHQSDQSVSSYAAAGMRTFFNGRTELLMLWLPWTEAPKRGRRAFLIV
jgi:hypothetical protein